MNIVFVYHGREMGVHVPDEQIDGADLEDAPAFRAHVQGAIADEIEHVIDVLRLKMRDIRDGIPE